MIIVLFLVGVDWSSGSSQACNNSIDGNGVYDDADIFCTTTSAIDTSMERIIPYNIPWMGTHHHIHHCQDIDFSISFFWSLRSYTRCQENSEFGGVST